jgi:L-arabinokinase
LTVAFYISGHGFGHASRQIEVINALGRRLPGDARVLIRTSAPRWLFDRTLTRGADVLPGECDTGIVQIDSLRLDEAATVLAAREFYTTFADRRDSETALLAAHDVRLVVADAPPLACAAAAAANIPCIVLSNFTWDWIYEAYDAEFRAKAPEVLPLIRAAYATALEGWRLPMHGGFETFASVIDVPFIARHAKHTRERTLARLALPSSRPLVLSSFGGYGLSGFDPGALDCRETWTVVITGTAKPDRLPQGIVFVDERQVYERGLRYEDLVAAVDVVATKPGYGIISECVANGTAMLYTSRGRFAEYDVMVREMPQVLRCAYIDQDALFAGRWRAALDALLASPPPPEHPPTNGADVASERIERALHRR